MHGCDAVRTHPYYTTLWMSSRYKKQPFQQAGAAQPDFRDNLFAAHLRRALEQAYGDVVE